MADVRTWYHGDPRQGTVVKVVNFDGMMQHSRRDLPDPRLLDDGLTVFVHAVSRQLD